MKKGALSTARWVASTIPALVASSSSAHTISSMWSQSPRLFRWSTASMHLRHSVPSISRFFTIVMCIRAAGSSDEPRLDHVLVDIRKLGAPGGGRCLDEFGLHHLEQALRARNAERGEAPACGASQHDRVCPQGEGLED